MTDAQAPGFSEYGEASGPIHLDNVICAGSEPNLLACSYTPASPPCTHENDAGVVCYNGRNTARAIFVYWFGVLDAICDVCGCLFVGVYL